MSARDRQAQLRWRAAFGLFAAVEYGEPVDAQLDANRVRVRRAGRELDPALETFIAYLTKRPLQLKDASPRALGRRPVPQATESLPSLRAPRLRRARRADRGAVVAVV